MEQKVVREQSRVGGVEEKRMRSGLELVIGENDEGTGERGR